MKRYSDYIKGGPPDGPRRIRVLGWREMVERLVMAGHSRMEIIKEVADSWPETPVAHLLSAITTDELLKE